MIKPLTSLRFIFAFMVFGSHLGFLEESKSNILSSIFNSIFHEGYIGVSFFFILSGFILAYNYQDGMLKNQKSKKMFYQARLARIFPLHVLTFILSLPFTYSVFQQSISVWLSQAITNLSLTQSYIPLKSIYFSFNAPSWSISNEMFFYLTFPFLILIVPWIKNNKSFIMLPIIAAVPFLTLIIPESYYHEIFYINPFIRIVDFLIGIFIFNIYQAIPIRDNNFKFDLMEISSILLLLVFFVFHQWIPQVARYSFYYWVPMGYLIFCFSFQKGKISKLLSKKVFIHLGEISFGFYMFHILVLSYFSLINSKFLHIENDFLITIITFSISLVVSHYSFILFETPMNNYIKKIILWNRKTTPTLLYK